jgi:hypothetical protein
VVKTGYHMNCTYLPAITCILYRTYVRLRFGEICSKFDYLKEIHDYLKEMNDSSKEMNDF